MRTSQLALKFSAEIANFGKMSKQEKMNLLALFKAHGLSISLATIETLAYRPQQHIHDYLVRNYSASWYFNLKEQLVEKNQYHLVEKFASGMLLNRHTSTDFERLYLLLRRKISDEFTSKQLDDVVTDEISIMVESNLAQQNINYNSSIRILLVDFFSKVEYDDIRVLIKIAIHSGLSKHHLDFIQQVDREIGIVDSELFEIELTQDNENKQRTQTIAECLARAKKMIVNAEELIAADYTMHQNDDRLAMDRAVPIPNGTEQATRSNTSIFLHLNRLIRGEVTLIKTFWVYYITVDLFFLLITKATTNYMPLQILLLLVYMPYAICMLPAVWNSASKYRGNIVWAYLAKITLCARTIVSIALILFIVFANIHAR